MKARLTAAIAAAAMAIPIAAASAAPALAAPARVLLTLQVTDRAGHRVAPTDAQVMSVATGTNIDLGSGTHRLLVPGRYNVAAWIPTGTGPNPSLTLADQVINLTRNTTLVLDARQGRKVRLILDDPAAQAEALEITPIVNGGEAFNPTTVFPPVGQTYVIPVSSRLMTLYVYSVWEKKGNTLASPSPFRYDIIRAFRGGIPRSPVIVTRRSQLARIDVTVRKTAANEQATLDLQPTPASGPLSLNMDAETTLGATPARLTSFRTPGFIWLPLVTWQTPTGSFRDFDVNQGPYGPGRFSELWGAAVLALGQDCAFGDLQGRSLVIGITGSCIPIGDPLHNSDEQSGGSQLFRLFLGSRLLGHTTNNQMNVRIPAGTHSYRLSLNAARAPGALVSTRVSGVWRFNATGTANSEASMQLFTFQLVPAGLNARNQAVAGSVTQVPLRIFDALDNPVTLPAVHVWASSNDGRTWRPVTVRLAGGHFLISVRNATTPGFTSLRVLAGDRHGNSEQLTVIRAWAVR